MLPLLEGQIIISELRRCAFKKSDKRKQRPSSIVISNSSVQGCDDRHYFSLLAIFFL